jgi:hypothetical protein
MIKWVESREGDFLYEFFLPEHEREAGEWLVRASALGNVLGERRGRLTWLPRFGPDMGDVAVAEAATEELIQEISRRAMPTEPGSYVPTEMTLPPVDPMTHAVLYGLIEAFVEAERELGLTLDQISTYLELPVNYGASGLHPFAVTARRDGRMRRMVALMHVMRNHPETAPLREALIEAVLAENIPLLMQRLAEVGLPSGPEEPMSR